MEEKKKEDVLPEQVKKAAENETRGTSFGGSEDFTPDKDTDVEKPNNEEKEKDARD